MIAIIAILAAILFPVFAQAREKARQTACLSNEKQLGLAIMQYTQDYDEAFPAGVSDVNGSLTGVGWAGACAPYIKNAGIFKCPDDSTGTHTTNGVVDGYPSSYGFNFNVAGKSDASLSAPASTVLAFEVTGDSALVTDGSEGTLGYTRIPPSGFMSTAGQGIDLVGPVTGMNNGLATFTSDDTTPTVRYATGAIGARWTPGANRPAWFDKDTGLHNNGSNWLAGDGHVKYLQPARVSSGFNATGADCLQDTDSPQAQDCTSVTQGMAAGTSSGKYTLTFSTQ